MESKQRLVTVQSGELSYEIDPIMAGRVTRMTYRGQELLVDAQVNPTNWGATYWTSPQADWGWPPVPEVDSLPYEVAALGKGWELSSQVATIGPRVLQIKKHFRPGPHPHTIDVSYGIVNRGDRAFSMANWEIARVPPGGLTFFPTGSHELTPIAPHAALHLEKRLGCSFFDHRQFSPGLSRKLHADGQGGFLAHATGSHLILKMFADTTFEQQAPGEGECEIFANLDGKYVEIEVQGAYVAIAPGQRHDFLVRTAIIPVSQLDLSDLEAWAQLAHKHVQTLAAPDLGAAWGPS